MTSSNIETSAERIQFKSFKIAVSESADDEGEDRMFLSARCQ